MFKLTTPTSIPLLKLPASALEALSNEILGPVDDIDLFTAFWNETETLLWHLNHDDTLPEDPLLAVALANPEYVTALDDGWYLLLVIASDILLKFLSRSAKARIRLIPETLGTLVVTFLFMCITIKLRHRQKTGASEP